MPHPLAVCQLGSQNLLHPAVPSSCQHLAAQLSAWLSAPLPLQWLPHFRTLLAGCFLPWPVKFEWPPTGAALCTLTEGHAFTDCQALPSPSRHQEELLASDLASALAQMHAAGRYGQLLLLADTCQASTLYGLVTAPNVLGVASSKLGKAAQGG